MHPKFTGTNHGRAGFWTELERPESSLSAAVSSLGYAKELTIFTIKDILGDTVFAEAPDSIPDGGRSIWLSGDPVHLTPEMYAAIAKHLGCSQEQRAPKRARLESVIAQAGPPAKRGAYPVRLPERLSGRDSGTQAWGRGRGFAGGPRGPQRGFSRVWRAARGGGRRPRRY